MLLSCLSKLLLPRPPLILRYTPETLMKTSNTSCYPPAKFGRLLVLLLCCCMPLSLAHADDWQFSGVNRIVAVGDIHGAYDAAVSTLQQAGIIDDHLAWSGGDTHLVLTGDLLDRGPGSRQVIDLIMRLERQAVRAGGQVHQLLGNHEVMNLIGDVRYVSDPEYAAFSEDESAEEREYWYQQYRGGQPVDADEQAIRELAQEAQVVDALIGEVRRVEVEPEAWMVGNGRESNHLPVVAPT